MKFYFYTNKNLMFDFLGRNIIAPDSIVRDIKKYHTISTKSDLFLFVTHKKLNRKSREAGIAEPEFVYPITLELSEIRETDGQAILVSKDEDTIHYTLSDLKGYDAEKHIGAYLIGEIPLSRVEKIYFDTQDEMDMFTRPSPDYWYPSNKYELLPEKDFSEQFDIELNEDQILAASGLSQDELIKGLRSREKKRAALLNFVNGTKSWQSGKYRFNVDERFQKLFGLKDSDVNAVLPHYVEAREGAEHSEDLSLVDDCENTRSINQSICDSICNILIEQPYNTQKQPEQILEILHVICEKIQIDCHTPQEANFIKHSFDEIEALISDTSKKGPEEIMADIIEPIDVLKSLLFVSKNPNRYDVFLESLNAYHADQITKRRSMVLWGLLNGLYGMPGEDYNKDNQQLWQFIEAYIYNQENGPKPSMSVTMPAAVIENGTVLGIKLKEERIISADEVRNIIIQSKDKLPSELYNKLFDAAVAELGSKKKAQNKGYTCIRFPKTDIDLHFEEGHEPSPSDSKKFAKVLGVVKELDDRMKNPVPNEKTLFRDYVEPKKKFQYVFDIDPEYWKRVFKMLTEKKDA